MESKLVQCFHCSEDVPGNTNFYTVIDGVRQPMCCAGCAAVAQSICDNDLTAYYQHRTSKAQKGENLIPEELKDTRVYNHPLLQQSFVRDAGEHAKEADLILEGITCAACLWLNEQHLNNLEGVLDTQINYTTRRAHIQWDDSKIQLSDILDAILSIGYIAHPYDPDKQRLLVEEERKTTLKQLGVAGILGMQVMILAVAMYAGDWFGMEQEYRQYFERISLLLILPILFYSARPFFKSAFADIRHLRVGMDIPVTLGIVTAFLASISTLVTGIGHVYFESIAMFVFFLLGSRYLETATRNRSAQAADNLTQALPATATRLTESEGRVEHLRIPAVELESGDTILVAAGEVFPADGLLQDSASIDESLLTGEHLPLHRLAGEEVIGGSVNIEHPVKVTVTATGSNSAIFSLIRLLDQTRQDPDKTPSYINRIASQFVSSLLLIALATGAYWYFRDSSVWLPVMLSVLVIACPCALSLATPAAIASASGYLFRSGMLITRSGALDDLANVDHVVFDKTGTLTTGKLNISEIEIARDHDKSHILDIAASLEHHSRHPVANAIVKYHKLKATQDVTDIVNNTGAGLSAFISGEQYFIGSARFIEKNTTIRIMTDSDKTHSATHVYLTSEKQLLAHFVLEDTLREHANELVLYLKNKGIHTSLFTGDSLVTANSVANILGISNVNASLLPQDKLALLKELQQKGQKVAVIGDGLNDAPILKAADISIAMGDASPLTASDADMILLSNSMQVLQRSFQISLKTQKIIRQNLLWASIYNLLAIPAAVGGFVAPWLAALGMSSSSLFVVLNAMRLNKE